jgi:hypothetical protein
VKADCRRCGGPLDSDVSRSTRGWLREVLACRCGYEEPAPRVPFSREEIAWRIRTVRGQRDG